MVDKHISELPPTITKSHTQSHKHYT